MTNIQNAVTNFIEQDVSIRRGLSRGIINTRALAKYIYQNLSESTSIDAVISAIRRYDTQPEPKDDIKKRYKIIADAKISSRTGIASVQFRKDMETRKTLMKLYDRIDFSKGEVLRIFEVSRFIKAILDESNLHYISELFPSQSIISREQKLGEISIVYNHDVTDVPGIFAMLGGELAQSRISIRDGVICSDEHIFIINEDDLVKALQALHSISKWGEKH